MNTDESGKMLWVVALLLFAAWGIGLLFGKGGFLHILLLCAIAFAFVLLIAKYRAAQDRPPDRH